MQKKVLYVIGEIFAEVSGQFYYLKNNGVLLDIRLSSYMNFANKVIKEFTQWYVQSKSSPEQILDQLHFGVWEGKLFEKMLAYQIHDSKWMLMHIEVLLFDNTVIYDKYWGDASILQQQYECVQNSLANISKHKGAIWEVKGKKYDVGVSFAMYSDLWLRSLDKDTSSVLYHSYRLSDFLPLSKLPS